MRNGFGKAFSRLLQLCLASCLVLAAAGSAWADSHVEIQLDIEEFFALQCSEGDARFDLRVDRASGETGDAQSHPFTALSNVISTITLELVKPRNSEGVEAPGVWTITLDVQHSNSENPPLPQGADSDTEGGPGNLMAEVADIQRGASNGVANISVELDVGDPSGVYDIGGLAILTIFPSGRISF